jgi:hypothetical protein
MKRSITGRLSRYDRPSKATGAATARANLAAKRELVVEAVRAWAEALEGPRNEAFVESEDLLEAWRDYREAEKKGNANRSRVT